MSVGDSSILSAGVGEGGSGGCIGAFGRQPLRQGMYLYHIYGSISRENNVGVTWNPGRVYVVFTECTRSEERAEEVDGKEGVLQRRIKIRKKKRKKTKEAFVLANQAACYSPEFQDAGLSPRQSSAV